jgi:hypothetical protein
MLNNFYMVKIMTKRTTSALTVALLGLVLGLSFVGTATAGDGKSCDGKKKGETSAMTERLSPSV